jgi:hypothetical protein
MQVSELELPGATVCVTVFVESRQVIALITAGGRIVMLAVAVRVVCACAIAVTVTIPLFVVGTVAGAV